MSTQASLPDGPLVAWYGDDFTGSAAVMEVLSFAGYPSILFFDIPTSEQLERFPGYRGVGVAGVSRSKGPEWMVQHLPAIYAFLKDVGAPIRHYKVCSTLDSSPSVGSIGQATDLALSLGEWAPIVMGAPEIGRYQAFGNLFAKAGSETFRLDRHPTMSVHPVTPMDEGDVVKHLAKQTNKKIGLVNLVDIKAGLADQRIGDEISQGKALVALDVVDDETLLKTGEAVWACSGNGLFAVGSQGLEYALVAAWQQAGLAPKISDAEPLLGVNQVAVISGSCSPITQEQIECAQQSGYSVISLDATKVIDDSDWQQEQSRAVDMAMKAIAAGSSPIMCTALGPSDPSIEALRSVVSRSRMAMEDVNENIGTGLGKILKTVLNQSEISRVAIAGGDTSSYGAQQLGLFGVSARSLLSPGAAVLIGHSEDAEVDGLEISLKGGQMGEPDYFLKLRDGQP